MEAGRTTRTFYADDELILEVSTLHATGNIQLKLSRRKDARYYQFTAHDAIHVGRALMQAAAAPSAIPADPMPGIPTSLRDEGWQLVNGSDLDDTWEAYRPDSPWAPFVGNRARGAKAGQFLLVARDRREGIE